LIEDKKCKIEQAGLLTSKDKVTYIQACQVSHIARVTMQSTPFTCLHTKQDYSHTFVHVWSWVMASSFRDCRIKKHMY